MKNMNTDPHNGKSAWEIATDANEANAIEKLMPVDQRRLVRAVCCWVDFDGSKLGKECKRVATHRAVFDSGSIPLCENHAPLGEKVGWKVVRESDLPNSELNP
jgi:hypothetical protein